MNILILGATGATGRLVVKQLLAQQHTVTALVRNPDALQAYLKEPCPNLTTVKGTALELSEHKLRDLIHNADAVISCLGHNLTLKGMYGAPRMLVRDSIQRILKLTAPDRTHRLKAVLMNSSGVRNLDLAEPISCLQRLVVGLLRMLVPPHLDNERAANLLRTQYKNQHAIEWVTVRPDSLVDMEEITEYTLHPSPTRSAIFDAGKTSRANVANLMVRLIQEENLWQQWRGKMPIIYNSEQA